MREHPLSRRWHLAAQVVCRFAHVEGEKKANRAEKRMTVRPAKSDRYFSHSVKRPVGDTADWFPRRMPRYRTRRENAGAVSVRVGSRSGSVSADFSVAVCTG